MVVPGNRSTACTHRLYSFHQKSVLFFSNERLLIVAVNMSDPIFLQVYQCILKGSCQELSLEINVFLFIWENTGLNYNQGENGNTLLFKCLFNSETAQLLYSPSRISSFSLKWSVCVCDCVVCVLRKQLVSLIQYKEECFCHWASEVFLRTPLSTSEGFVLRVLGLFWSCRGYESDLLHLSHIA